MVQSSTGTPSSEGKAAILMLFFFGIVLAIGFAAVMFESGNLMSMDDIGRGEAVYLVVQEYVSIAMFMTLAILLFSGYPVAFILGGLSMLYGMVGYFLDIFALIEFFNFVPRIWGHCRREFGSRRGAGLRLHGRDAGTQRDR